IGDENKAVQVQGPHGQQGSTYASIDQNGNGNVAEQYQVKYGNDAFIIQDGNGNTARQAQDLTLPLDAEGSNNYAKINQDGDRNLAEQYQNGWSNNAIVDQIGSGNSAYHSHDAWVSEPSILQEGAGNYASQIQTGSLNDAVVE